MEKKRIMIVVPHQDDEILMAAGVIRRAVLEGCVVDIVMATNGDCGCEDFSKGRIRLRETLHGIGLLGVSLEHLHILGYADTGMIPRESFLTWMYSETDGEKVFSSRCSESTYGLEDKAEYHMEQYGIHGSYCRDNFLQDLMGILEEKRPELVITTAPQDQHGDHSALYRFVMEALERLAGQGFATEVYCGLVHSPEGDDTWPERNTPFFDCPEGLQESGLCWEQRIRIPVPEEMHLSRGGENLKYQALCQYETALEPGAYDFLMAFIKEEEIFWKMQPGR